MSPCVHVPSGWIIDTHSRLGTPLANISVPFHLSELNPVLVNSIETPGPAETPHPVERTGAAEKPGGIVGATFIEAAEAAKPAAGSIKRMANERARNTHLCKAYPMPAHPGANLYHPGSVSLRNH
jgi:hypothetical protein